MLFYTEGFDLHNYTLQGLDVGAGGMQDAGYYWRGGTSTGYAFNAGYLGGQAIRVTGGGANYMGGSALRKPHTNQPMRVGFWARHEIDYFVNMLVFVPQSFANNGVYFTYRGNGQYRLDTPGGVIDSLPIATAGWHYYEIYMNMGIGKYTMSRDGFPIIDVENYWSYSNNLGYNGQFGTLSGDTRPVYHVDHVWATDGEYPAGEGILAVTIAGAVDAWQSDTGGDGPGFRGRLVMNGVSYQTPRINAIVSSAQPYAEGWNLTNVLNYTFNQNPATNLPWTLADLNQIEQWGLCYGTDFPDGNMRLAGMLLAVLYDNEGMPIIRNTQATNAASFSGPWTKTDPTLSFTGHVNPVPRPDTPDEADALSLKIAGPGCILFAGPAYVPETEEPPIFEVGLTFAEEFREDYRDFVRIDGGTSYDSWFITGYSVLGEGNRKFQDNYVTVNYENVPTGAAYIQGLWDYSENADTGRWSMRQSIDNKGGDYRHGTRRLKIRGHGKALQIKVTNKGDRPFVINGWSSLVTSNTSV